jgi:protocatechuate 3,4-dioxygenase alpha subunit
MAGRTPSQTIGPFFHEALRWKDGAKVTFARAGKRVVVRGRILDGAGKPVPDALIETWQRAPEGESPVGARGKSRPHGLGRVETANDGRFRLETLMPGGALPSLEVVIFMRGLLTALRTRVYLASEEDVRADPQLAAIAGSPRLKTLVATRRGDSEFTWDVRLQGKGETVFFAP